MDCEATRQILLDPGTDELRRRDTYLALQHLEHCATCQAAMRQYDRISKALDASAEVSTPPDGWAQFERNLTETILQPRHRWRFSSALAVAASLLIAITAFEIGRHGATAPVAAVAIQATGVDSAEPIHFVPRDLPTDVNAFEQVSKVFDGRASWVLVSRDASDVGVVSEPIAPVRQVLLVRLTMSHGLTMVSDADLMIVPGQTADLKVPLGEGQSAHYRIGASAQEPTRLSIWLEVANLHGEAVLGALSTTLQVQPGQKFNAGQLVTSAGEYQLKVGFAQSELEVADP